MNLNLTDILIMLLFMMIVLEFSKHENNFIYMTIILCLMGILFYDASLWNSNLFEVSLWKLMFLGLLYLSFFIVIELTQEKTFDIVSLLVLVLAGSVMLVLSDNLLMLYLGLELQTFSMFILVAKNSSSIKSSEAGLKYFMLGAMSSGFFLLSVVVMFLSGLDLSLKQLLLLNKDSIVYISFVLMTMSFCFKLSLFPFHFWMPDMYEGSSWDTVTLMATLPKISMICILVQILVNSNLMLLFSLLSIGMGTLGALNQSKMKSLLGYSGMSHVGFMVLGLVCMSQQGLVVGSLYLIMYMLTMMSMFIVMTNFNYNNDFIIELGGIKHLNSIMAITLVLLVLSTAGMPPLSGFMSKWYLVWLTVDANYSLSSFLMMIFSAMGLGYYLSVAKMMYFQKSSSYFMWKNMLEIKKTKIELSTLLLGFLLFVTLFLIMNFSFVVDLLNFQLSNMF